MATSVVYLTHLNLLKYAKMIYIYTWNIVMISKKNVFNKTLYV